jgi:hypothetical protein
MIILTAAQYCVINVVKEKRVLAMPSPVVNRPLSCSHRPDSSLSQPFPWLATYEGTIGS